MCPYCGSNLFVSATTTRRDEGEPVNPSDPSSARLGQTWNNECVLCGQWCVYKDALAASVALVDPSDPTSAEVT